MTQQVRTQNVSRDCALDGTLSKIMTAPSAPWENSILRPTFRMKIADPAWSLMPALPLFRHSTKLRRSCPLMVPLTTRRGKFGSPCLAEKTGIHKLLVSTIAPQTVIGHACVPLGGKIFHGTPSRPEFHMPTGLMRFPLLLLQVQLALGTLGDSLPANHSSLLPWATQLAFRCYVNTMNMWSIKAALRVCLVQRVKLAMTRASLLLKAVIPNAASLCVAPTSLSSITVMLLPMDSTTSIFASHALQDQRAQPATMLHLLLEPNAFPPYVVAISKLWTMPVRHALREQKIQAAGTFLRFSLV